jgi:hypothetical protein
MHRVRSAVDERGVAVPQCERGTSSGRQTRLRRSAGAWAPSPQNRATRSAQRVDHPS